MMLRVLDLFAGIGGFSYGLEHICGGFETVAFVEKDPFCQSILKKNFPGVPIYEDINTFPADEFAGSIDVITGGIPCQPASVAGSQRGSDDDRWLWPVTFDVIQRVSPKWIIIENVPGLFTLDGGMVFDDLLTTLERQGYCTQTYCVPACAVDARHRRDRVWIVANAEYDGSSAAERDTGSISGASTGPQGTQETLEFA